MRRTTSPELSLPDLSHPLGSREMALPDLPGALRILLYVEAQHNPGDLPPVGAFLIGIEQPKIRH
jgi:hypothetical protein